MYVTILVLPVGRYKYLALDRFAAYILAQKSKFPQFYSQKWTRKNGLQNVPKIYFLLPSILLRFQPKKKKKYVVSARKSRQIQTCLYRANGRGGFGSQTAADSPWRPLCGSCGNIPQNCATAKRGCLGREKAFGQSPAVCPPKQSRPFFTHYGILISPRKQKIGV